MIPKEITLEKWKFQSQYYVTGHIDFEIKVEYEDGDGKSIKKKDTIFRRYSEIRTLYKTLILKCPGCLIPNIPDKSIWFQINYENQEQITERMGGIREFLSYLVKHKILRKNKEVIYFFSPDFKRKDDASKNSSNKDNKIKEKDKDDFDDDDDNLDFQNPFDSDKNEQKKINDDNSDEDIEPLKEYIEEYTNKNKGIMAKGKQMIGSLYNNVKSYISSNNNNNEAEGEENNNNYINKNSNMFRKLSKEDEEFIKKKTRELGEDFDVNNYNEKINRLNDGLKNIIENFEKLIAIKNVKIKALENIVDNDKNHQKLIKKNDFDDDDNSQSKTNLNVKSNIKKLRQYYNLQQKYLNKSVNDNLTNIKKYQIFLQELLDIFTRKKEHLNFLGRLHSHKTDLEKQKESNNTAANVLQNKLDELKNNINHEIKFIKKMNKDLKYEIEQYKNNQEDIYIYINSLFKEKSNTIKIAIESLNAENTDIEEDEKEEKSKDVNQKNKEKTKDYVDENEGDDF